MAMMMVMIRYLVYSQNPHLWEGGNGMEWCQFSWHEVGLKHDASLSIHSLQMAYILLGMLGFRNDASMSICPLKMADILLGFVNVA